MLEYGNICSLFYYTSQLLSTYVSSAYWVCLGGSYVWDIFLLTKLDQCVSVWCHDFEQNFNRGTSDRVVINGNPLHYPCLEKPMDGGAWQATVMGSQWVGYDFWVTSLHSELFSIVNAESKITNPDKIDSYF